ncbi:hypothetical protein HOC67_03270 [Candidatus Peregrinibacteria bacterium]|jgi:hypothetical protein|nr:hypothetical protein [Candidatus Peregrinibacteria bacterium]
MEKIHNIQMTKDENEAWIRAMAEICIDMFLEENKDIYPFLLNHEVYTEATQCLL